MGNCNTCPSHGSCGKDETQCGIENNEQNKIKNIIAVMSGKGGVGKSTMSVMIARQLAQRGYRVGILDADITGPSIPRLLHIEEERARGTETLIYPVESSEGIKVMSLNLVVEKEDEAVIWRGPAIVSVVKQFWTGVYWGELDYLIIDMPPGTGDVPLTVMQTIPIKGVVMVSIPQDMISMIVSKSINMARKMNIDIFGVIENMSYIKCPDCDKTIKLFNGENTEKFLNDMKVDLLGELPMHRAITNYGDLDHIEEEDEIAELFDPIVEKIIAKSKKKLIL